MEITTCTCTSTYTQFRTDIRLAHDFIFILNSDESPLFIFPQWGLNSLIFAELFLYFSITINGLVQKSNASALELPLFVTHHFMTTNIYNPASTLKFKPDPTIRALTRYSPRTNVSCGVSWVDIFLLRLTEYHQVFLPTQQIQYISPFISSEQFTRSGNYIFLSSQHINGSVQDCSISIAMEILQSCTKPSIWSNFVKTHLFSKILPGHTP